MNDRIDETEHITLDPEERAEMDQMLAAFRDATPEEILEKWTDAIDQAQSLCLITGRDAEHELPEIGNAYVYDAMGIMVKGFMAELGKAGIPTGNDEWRSGFFAGMIAAFMGLVQSIASLREDPEIPEEVTQMLGQFGESLARAKAEQDAERQVRFLASPLASMILWMHNHGYEVKN